MLEKNLQRDESPLDAGQWNEVDNLVVRVARNQLVARKILSVFGPLGAGVQAVEMDIYASADIGEIGLLGTEETHAVHAEARQYMPLPLIYKDFQLFWRDLETSARLGTPIDLSPAAAAATYVARAEDSLILNGDENLCIDGILNVEWRNTMPLLNWDDPGQAFQNVVNAYQKLIQDDYYGPFALVVSPDMYAKMQRVYDNTGVLEIEQVRQLMNAGVHQSPVMPDNGAVVISTGPENLDIAISQDMITAYLGPDNMNHPFRVFESLTLRIKRPQAICTLGEGNG
jgi:uncharacterized linocin/CFP29 family protein